MRVNINGVWKNDSDVSHTVTSDHVVVKVPITHTQIAQNSYILYIPDSFVAQYPGRKLIIFWHGANSTSIDAISSAILNSENIYSNIKGVSVIGSCPVNNAINTTAYHYGLII